MEIIPLKQPVTYQDFDLEKKFDNLARSIVQTLFGVEPVCPKCGKPLSQRSAKSYLAGKRAHCSTCKWYGFWREGTPLFYSKINNLQFLIMVFKVGLPNDIDELSAALNISPTTGRKLSEIILQRGFF